MWTDGHTDGGTKWQIYYLPSRSIKTVKHQQSRVWSVQYYKIHVLATNDYFEKSVALKFGFCLYVWYNTDN